ncbi:uncharacterized protein RJT20DRAFT_99352 [Scheffersomyces xylosifermentans]|uniref:uncharacterized protein n=1 Tax=Scheffersomyces xylosifermentans TaxID=1304137 RepID=UPI00315C7DE2
MPENTRDVLNPPARVISSSAKRTKSTTPPPLSSPPTSYPSSPITETLTSNDIQNNSQAPSGSINRAITRNDSQSSLNNSSNSSIPVNSNSTHASNNNTNASNILSSSPSQPPQPPNVTRRSSFGLNFLSSFTNSIRTGHPPSPTENPHSFMSNSPTIANLSSFATLEDELIAPNGNSRGHQPRSRRNSSRQSNRLSNSQGPHSNGHGADHPITQQESPSSNNAFDESHDQVTTPNGIVENNGARDGRNDSISNGIDKDGFYSVRLTPLIDHSSSASGLYFSPVIRKIKPSSNISIGRYTEKNKAAAHAPQGSSAPIVFKSKVVSRTHALFQCNEDGQWFLRDCKSSSGTFLNHIRLSPASQESTLMPLIDGDIIQLGMDYRGGTEEVYRCVKMRCEFNKSWQRKVNQFNLEIHKKLKNLQINNEDNEDSRLVTNPITGSSTNVDDLAECAICLMKIEPCQALFISPCSHAWHYKCIRPIIIKSYPQFYCPNCRTMCDLETDLDEDD